MCNSTVTPKHFLLTAPGQLVTLGTSSRQHASTHTAAAACLTLDLSMPFMDASAHSMIVAQQLRL